VDGRTNDELIDDYLRRERTSAALRMLWVGALLITLGVAGTCFVYRWWVHGGVLPNVVLAAPFALVAGFPVTGYGAVQLVRARR
jgi:hypothetical protein